MAAGAAEVLVPLLGRRRVGKAAAMVLLRMTECADARAVLSTPGAALQTKMVVYVCEYLCMFVSIVLLQTTKCTYITSRSPSGCEPR